MAEESKTKEKEIIREDVKATEKKSKLNSKDKDVKKAKPGKTARIKEVKIAKPVSEKDVAKVDDAFSILKFVLMTEKAVQVIEKENKLVFIVDRKADKANVKTAVESAFNSPVSDVQTMIDQEGRKKAMVKFRNAGAAGDIAIKLGII